MSPPLRQRGEAEVSTAIPYGKRFPTRGATPNSPASTVSFLFADDPLLK